VLRVVLGRARPDTEWSGKLSGLQFASAVPNQADVDANQASQSRTSRSRGVISSILAVPRSIGNRSGNWEGVGDIEAGHEGASVVEDTEEKEELNANGEVKVTQL
jgi:hypothetical protein